MSDSLALIDPRAAEAYVEGAGWRLVGRSQLGSKWRFAQEGRDRNLALPNERLEVSDRILMLKAALRVLEAVERRPREEIVRRLVDAGRDVVRFRLIGPELHDGEIPIMAAPVLLAGSRDALIYAARAEFRPRPFYGKGGNLPSDVNSFLDGARVGATEDGSVILTVHSEVRDSTPEGQFRFLAESDRSPAEIPFERRVLRRLVEAIAAAKRASHLDVSVADRHTIFDAEMESGLSANLCDALAELSGEKFELNADIEVSVRWSRTVPTNEVESVATISGTEVRALASVAEILREIAPMYGRTAYGSVKTVSHVSGADDGWADMHAEIDDRVLTVRVQLSGDEVEYAKEALSKNTTHDLRVEGTLEKRGQRWEIAHPTAVSVVVSTTRRPD